MPLPAIRPPHCHRGSRRRRWPPPPWSARGPGEGSPPVPSCPPGTPPGTSRRTGGQGVSDPQRRLVLVTAGLGVGTAGAEVAALRRIDEVRRPAGDDLELGVRLVLEPGDRLEERLCVGHADAGEQHARGLPQRSCLRTSPRSIGPSTTPRSRDEHEGHEPLPLLLGEEVQDLGLHGHVERSGLVGEQQPRSASQADRDDHPLTQTRELVRYSFNRWAGSGIPTWERRARAVSLVSSLSMSRWYSSDSVIWRPTRTTGLSEVMGSWKTIAISVPQRLCIRSGP